MASFKNPLQNHVEPTLQNIMYSSVVSSIEQTRDDNTLNRYKNKVTITLYDGTTFKEFIRKSMLYTDIADDDQYYYITAGKKQRPDIISRDIYNTPSLYWIILSDNNLVSPLQINSTLTLRIPTIGKVVNNSKII